MTSMRRNRSTPMARALVIFVLLAFSSSPPFLTEASKTKTWTVYHRLLTPGGTAAAAAAATNDWGVRGTIELAVRDGGDGETDEDVSIKVENAAGALTEQLAQSLTSSAGSYYQLKLVEEPPNSNNKNKKNNAQHYYEVLTSVPACSVRRANFRDEFVLQLQPGTARALSVSYLPIVSPLAPPTCDAYVQGSLPSSADGGALKFESKASWETSVPGMVVGKPPPAQADPTKPANGGAGKIKPPPGLKWIPGKRKTATTTGPNGGAGGGSGNPLLDDPAAPEQEAGMFGFFKRYWYIFLPMMIINLMGAAAPTEEPQPQPQQGPGAAGGGAAAGAVAAGGAAAATAAAGSPVRQRRGKRD